jgi:hypothetical protein
MDNALMKDVTLEQLLTKLVSLIRGLPRPENKNLKIK